MRRVRGRRLPRCNPANHAALHLKFTAQDAGTLDEVIEAVSEQLRRLTLLRDEGFVLADTVDAGYVVLSRPVAA